MRSEQALRRSEEQLRRLIGNLKGSHFLCRHDTQGVFTYVSESLTDILGCLPDEFMTHYNTYLTDHPGNRVVGLSMFEEPGMVERMHQAGAERYVLKIAPAEELLPAVRGG